jgi:hypothetical protein
VTWDEREKIGTGQESRGRRSRDRIISILASYHPFLLSASSILVVVVLLSPHPDDMVRES